MSGSTTVRAGTDTWADQTRPSANYNTRVNLQIGGAAGALGYAFLYFHNPAPKSATIQSAVLQFYTRSALGASAVTINATRVATSTKFSQLNWTNKPGVTGSVASTSQVANAANTLWQIDVTALLQTIANGAANYGFRLDSPSAARILLWALSASDHRPSLSVTWSDAPQAPTGLVPAGNQVIGLAKPVVQFDYTDIGGDTTVGAVQVQIDPNANWTTPAWDSGVVATTDPELDLSKTSYPGLAANGSTSWRVRVQDGAGLWSRWSARSNGVGARFQYVTKGVLALLSPSTANARVADWTPEILWQFTGRTQQSWRLVIADPTDPTNWLYTTGRRNGPDAAFTIPKGVLTDFGATYQLMVDVWDAQDRVSTPGDPTRVRQVLNFVLVEDATTNPPTNLAGSSDPLGKPFVTLTFQRAVAPDAFNIARDGKWVDSGLDPADLIVSAGHYRYVDRGATANVDHTWKVQAVVNHKASAGNPTWTGQLDTVSAWLVHHDDPTSSDHLVAFMDPDVSFTMPEVAATYEPVGSNHVVRVTQEQRGVEGTISGRIIDYAGLTVAQYESHLLWFKARPTTPFRLMVGDHTWRVLVGDVVVAPMRIPGSVAMTVSLSFWSLDGVPTS